MTAPAPSSQLAALAETLLAPWAQARAVLLAVSGGPDSLALMLLASAWTKAAPGRPALHAATVDHGLRPEAAQEAQLAATAAKREQIAHTILHWHGEKPSTGIQEAARNARYDLLTAHAREIGADVLMTAHHADDQAETILFRLLRGSGVTGLAGMRAQSLRGGVILARPLLTLRKQALIDICTQQAQPFADDPSNRDPRYRRTHLRALMNTLEDQGFGTESWTRLAGRLARAEDALSHTARLSAQKCALPSQHGEAIIDMGLLLSEPLEIALRVLAATLEKAGAVLPIRLDRLEYTLAKLAAAQRAGAKLTLTLAGCRLRLDSKSLLHLAKEPERRRGRKI